MPPAWRLSAGEARITRGHRLKARYIIHTVGPVWRGGTAGEDEILASAYASSLALARAHDLRSLAYPAISTGVYGFPPDRAARIAVGTVHRLLAERPRSTASCSPASAAARATITRGRARSSEFRQPTLEAVHLCRQIPREQGLAHLLAR